MNPAHKPSVLEYALLGLAGASGGQITDSQGIGFVLQ